VDVGGIEAAAERGGVQPVISLTAEKAGSVVVLRAVAEAPAGAPPIVRVQWDLDGDGEYEIDEPVRPGPG
jgi:hypothetical protein